MVNGQRKNGVISILAITLLLVVLFREAIFARLPKIAIFDCLVQNDHYFGFSGVWIITIQITMTMMMTMIKLAKKRLVVCIEMGGMRPANPSVLHHIPPKKYPQAPISQQQPSSQSPRKPCGKTQAMIACCNSPYLNI